MSALGQKRTWGRVTGLMELKSPLKKGDKVPVTLKFEKAGDATLTFEIEGIGAMGPSASQGNQPTTGSHQP